MVITHALRETESLYTAILSAALISMTRTAKKNGPHIISSERFTTISLQFTLKESVVQLRNCLSVHRETESDSQEMAEGASSSKGTDRAKKPRLKPTAMLQQEIDWLRNEREEFKKEREESNQQLVRRRQEHKREMDELKDLLRQQTATISALAA